jgi:ABC-type multidrug transport system ATPase subunit
MFGENIAVDNLDLSMYSGQIFSLLGHNGAGKTTVIGILIGMITPTSGYSSVAGKNIQTEMLSIRKNIGVCLQNDCLFPELTVKALL